MSLASTRRYFLRRAIERGDSRLGMIVGLLLSLLCGLASSSGLILPLELRFLDYSFQHRPAIRESDKIVLVDIDDLSLRELEWPIPRRSYAQALVALDHLGARQIDFDVQFRTIIPAPNAFDQQTGEYVLNDGDRALRSALGRSGKVALAFSFDFERSEAGSADRAFVSRVSEAMGQGPDLPFAELRRTFQPKYDPRELKLLQYAYWLRRCQTVLDAKSPPVSIDQAPSASRRPQDLFPPLYPFLERAEAVGCVNATYDADGVLRRPMLLLQGKERWYPYLGLEMALRDFETPEDRIETVLRPGAVDVRRVARGDGSLKGQVSLPVDAEGRLLVNWAGNRRRRPEECFVHIPFRRILEYYQQRYESLDGNVRRTLAQLSESERQELEAEKFLRLMDRLQQVLSGSLDLSPADYRSLEERLENRRAKMLGELTSDLAAIDERLRTITAPRPREQALALRRNRQELIAALVAPDEAERQLRPVVEGKICLVGSAYTASGDLHATPLGSATPGMDVLANVANMVLTGQVIRRAPGWVNFIYLLTLGLLVSFYVTHWNATGSAIATLATTLASVGLFWVLFTGPAILIAGAGPVVTSLLSFAGVTAYKELVTQRSKRKLQRELEKNTSPALVKILMEHPEFLSQPRKMLGTFFFSDVKSFTSITEKMDAEVLFPFINRYLDRVTQALIGHEAFVDKYIGDGIMALFGIPVPTPNHAFNACRAALDCQFVLKSLNAEFAKEGLPEVKMRIGIHSGEVRAGNVGSLYRSNYTVLGDNVNLSARLEGANKEYDTSIMISEATWDLVSERVAVRELDRIRVVGKRKPVRIYELLGVAGGVLPLEAAFLETYAAGLAAFKERRWAESMDQFQKALKLKPGDKPSATYVERIKVFQIMPPPPDWEGVFELTSK